VKVGESSSWWIWQAAELGNNDDWMWFLMVIACYVTACRYGTFECLRKGAVSEVAESLGCLVAKIAITY
jgi:hypothetical protein